MSLWLEILPARSGRGSKGFAKESEVLVTFRLEVDIAVQFFTIPEEQKTPGLKIQMQTLR